MCEGNAVAGDRPGKVKARFELLGQSEEDGIILETGHERIPVDGVPGRVEL